MACNNISNGNIFNNGLVNLSSPGCGSCGTDDRFLRGRCKVGSGTGGAGPLPILDGSSTNSISVVDVCIDTRNMRDPSILLIFNAIISLPAGSNAMFNFEITRTLVGGLPSSVGATYTYVKSTPALSSESFGFQFFDTELIQGIYNYSVRLAGNSVLSGVSGATITNATLSAVSCINF